MVVHATAPDVTPEAVARWRSVMALPAPKRPRRGETAGLWVDHLETALREMAALLHGEYGTPHLGNMSDPTDEFAYIVLSRKTAERAYIQAFEALKARGPWGAIQHLDIHVIADTIHGCGLERKKASALVDGLAAIRARFGAPDLARASSLSDDDLFEFLVSLPEVGPKSALCIMLYGFHRAVFPVDAHVGRILARTGTFTIAGVELGGAGHKERQQVLRELVPPDLRYQLHVNLVAHGRSTCSARAPACDRCIIRRLCSWADDHPGGSRTMPGGAG